MQEKKKKTEFLKKSPWTEKLHGWEISPIHEKKKKKIYKQKDD